MTHSCSRLPRREDRRAHATLNKQPAEPGGVSSRVSAHRPVRSPSKILNVQPACRAPRSGGCARPARRHTRLADEEGNRVTRRQMQDDEDERRYENTTTSPWTRRTSTKRSMDATTQARAGLQKRIEDTYASSIQ